MRLLISGDISIGIAKTDNGKNVLNESLNKSNFIIELNVDINKK